MMKALRGLSFTACEFENGGSKGCREEFISVADLTSHLFAHPCLEMGIWLVFINCFNIQDPPDTEDSLNIAGTRNTRGASSLSLDSNATTLHSVNLNFKPKLNGFRPDLNRGVVSKNQKQG
jgi:hypothetical protein